MSLTEKIIENVVETRLREIEKDPREGVKKLMGGRETKVENAFLRELFLSFSDDLARPNSVYYPMLRELVARVDRARLRAVIARIVACTRSMRAGEAPLALLPAEREGALRAARAARARGAWCYVLARDTESATALSVYRAVPDGLCLVPVSGASGDISARAAWPYAVVAVDLGGVGAAALCRALRAEGLLYVLYFRYGASDREFMLGGAFHRAAEACGAPVVLTAPREGLSRGAAEEIRAHLDRVRRTHGHGFVTIDAGDVAMTGLQ